MQDAVIGSILSLDKPWIQDLDSSVSIPNFRPPASKVEISKHFLLFKMMRKMERSCIISYTHELLLMDNHTKLKRMGKFTIGGFGGAKQWICSD